MTLRKFKLSLKLTNNHWGGGMKIIVFLLTTLSLVATASANINCIGKRKIISANITEVTAIDLEKQSHGPKNTSHRGDIELLHFSMLDNHDGSYLMLITEGPEYTKGTSVRAGFDNRNELKSTIVNGSTVYTLLCNKN